MSVSITFDANQLSKRLNKVKENINAAVRPAAQAGAQVLYEAVKRNAPRSEKAHVFYGTNGKYLFQAGTLKDSIYQVYSKDRSGEQKAVYHIAWNHQKCPYGFMVEFGTSRAPAHPFLRPARALLPDAREAMKAEFMSRLGGA